jgi:hypothetical protein
MPKIHLSKVFWFTCLAVLALSGLLAWLDQSGHFLQGLLGYSILLAGGQFGETGTSPRQRW